MTHTRIAVPAHNNFDLLRFVFAAVVVLYHARVLSQAPQLAFLGVLSADLAVRAFFVVSGFLVFMSFERSASTRRYFGKRIRRIYPAYFAVVAGAAVLGAFITELPWSQYFSGGLLRYLAANLVFANFLAPDLPGVFVHNPMTEVNGALWTIKIEVMFYAAVPMLAWLAGRYGRLAVLGVAYAFAIVWAQVFASLAAQTGISLYGRLSYQFPGMLSYFASGALCYYYLPMLQKRWTWVAALGIAGLMVARTFATTQPYFEPAALAAVIVWLALGIRCFGNFARYGDLSYGIYIIHAPVLQTLVAAGVFAASAAGGFVLAITVILVLAFASWHLVERPFLRRGSHYVVANTGA